LLSLKFTKHKYQADVDTSKGIIQDMFGTAANR